MRNLVRFDGGHCHKWAQLMCQRKGKLDNASSLLKAGNLKAAKVLFREIFFGVTGKQVDPGMAGSLLYHMAMVTKMETETRFLLKELMVSSPGITQQLELFYSTFASDVQELARPILPSPGNSIDASSRASLGTEEKIRVYTELYERTRIVEHMIDDKSLGSLDAFQSLFQDWGKAVVSMRLRQELETIRALLTSARLVDSEGILRVDEAMDRAKEEFGRETVNIALNVTLKVGMRREKLQSIMLSDHFINYTMDLNKLDGQMQFLNCPIYGSHKYIGAETGITDAVASLFCKHFCFAHAKAMLEAVLPFSFALTHPRRMATHDICEFYLKLGYSPDADNLERFVPLVVSWNLTRKCNLKCAHCYINATTTELKNELTTEESYRLIDQISKVSRPLLILSGGEPLMREDVYDIIKYGTSKGFRMGLGSNGSLIDANVADKLRVAGLATASISLDSNKPALHDAFRGVVGSWNKAIQAIKTLREHGILVQVNTTLTQENYSQIDDIMSKIEKIGVENFHLFFLVPTGRGAKMTDISPIMYEDMIKETFAKTHTHRLNVRPSCAPQFMRIAQDRGIDMRQWIRGCLAGLYYCRIYPNGDITPCPYLPVKLGNIRQTAFKDIWFSSSVFKALRNPDSLKGKCGLCSYRNICGGCRARAYGLSGDFIDFCGDLHEPTELNGNYLAEDPWCTHVPVGNAN